MNVLSSKFFLEYMWTPYGNNDLTPKEKLQALVASVAIGILSLGIVHLVSATILLGKKIFSKTDATKNSNNDGLNINSIKELAETSGFVAFYKNGLTGFLGNFHPCKISLWGQKFQCAEAAFQWRKYHLATMNKIHSQESRDSLATDENFRKFNSVDGEGAFQLRQNLDFAHTGVYAANWHKGVKDQVMWEVLQAKFQSPQLLSQLKATGTAYLLEHNQKKDRDAYWSDDHDGTGFNMLGKMLTAIRDGKGCPSNDVNVDPCKSLRIQYAKNL